MKISCVVVSFNNGKLLEEAIMSVLAQTRPPDEVIVADDASTDGSRQLLRGLSGRYSIIKPILRERNLGVSANRDLAIREASGDFITSLDGDDRFLPIKLEAEEQAVRQRRDVIAYSDVRLVDRKNNRFRSSGIAEFSRLAASERVRWLLIKTKQLPREPLVPKDVHMRIGGYNHGLRTYEDWDYMLRLAAQPLSWAHSGTEGVEHHPGGGLSRQASLKHARDELRVLRLNYGVARQQVGLPLFMAAVGRVVASRSKWAVLQWYWRKKARIE